MRIRSWDNVATLVLAVLMFGGGLAIIVFQARAMIDYTPDCVPDADSICTWGVGGKEASVQDQRDSFMPGASIFLLFGVALVIMGVVAGTRTIRKIRRGF